MLGFSQPITSSTPDDVRILAHALQQDGETIDVDNCGTAMRFLTAYFAAQPGKHVVLTGSERMYQRPIGPLVEHLRAIGADIRYMQSEGFPPLEIHGQSLDLQHIITISPEEALSTQFISALLLIGANLQTSVQSPYIDMTRALIERRDSSYMEYDWSAAAFWYERVALGIEKNVFLYGLKRDDLQGDKVVVEIFQQLGVSTEYQADGISIQHNGGAVTKLTVDFSACPDLYPALFVTCHTLGIQLDSKGIDRLKYKESDRLLVMTNNLLRTSHHLIPFAADDHRVAMAYVAAGYDVDNTLCIRKSYPDFIQQISVTPLSKQLTRIVPRRGINDLSKGKKTALSHLIQQAQTPYVWLSDDDVLYPAFEPKNLDADLYILPLRMQQKTDTLIERLQCAEYAAIQSLTILSAKINHPVMCSGANLIVRRETWLRLASELHPEIASGDDMFLLEACKRHNLSIRVLDDEKVTASICALPTWEELKHQRMRWAGKAAVYTDKDILICGLTTLIINILQVLCPVILLFKFPIDYHLIRMRQLHTPISTALLLEIAYPIYILWALIGGLKRAPQNRPNW